MAKKVKVIFAETVKGQFRVGDQQEVKLGYARNFLFPRKLAFPVTDAFVAQIKSVEKKAAKHLVEAKKRAEAADAAITDKNLSFTVKTHDGGKLYGSISNQELANDLIKKFKAEIDKYDIRISAPIRQIGDYQASIDIHPDINIQLNITVNSENEKEDDVKKAKEEAAKKAEEEAKAAEEASAEAPVEEAIEEAKEDTPAEEPIAEVQEEQTEEAQEVEEAPKDAE